MDWHIVLEVVGWLGSALLVFSVLQTKFMRFRILNGVASFVLVLYNAVVGVWPMVGMNAVLVIIDVYFIIHLRGDAKAEKAFTYVKADLAMRKWFYAAHGIDLETFYPGIGGQLITAEADVLFHQDTAIGIVAFVCAGDSAELVADYVIPSYRDYAPGAFVYSQTGPLAAHGIRTVSVHNPSVDVAKYLVNMGYTESDGAYVREI